MEVEGSLRSWRFLLVGSRESWAKPGQNEWRSREGNGARATRLHHWFWPGLAQLSREPTNKNRQLRRLAEGGFHDLGAKITIKGSLFLDENNVSSGHKAKPRE